MFKTLPREAQTALFDLGFTFMASAASKIRRNEWNHQKGPWQKEIIIFFRYPLTNRTLSWRGRCCARASLLWVPLQHRLSCWRGHYKYWHNESKKCPGEGFFQGPSAEKRLPSGRFLLNKGLISWNNNEAVTWSAAPPFHPLCHLLLRLSAVKESKKMAPSLLAPRVASLTPSALLRVRHQRFGAPMATAREARIVWRRHSYTGDSTTGLTDPSDAVGDAFGTVLNSRRSLNTNFCLCVRRRLSWR